MARLKVALTEDEVRKTGVADIRKKYNELARDYNRITEGDLYYCHSCGEFHAQEAFYLDKRFASGLYPECKKTLLLQATDYDKKTNTYTDNKEKTKMVFRKLDIPFIASLYRSSLTTISTDAGERTRETAYQHMLVIIKSLPAWKNKTYENSEFDEDDTNTDVNINENSRILKSAKKRFGNDYTPSELVWLENEYQDWICRYECNQKAQEEVFENLSIIKLLKKKAIREGKPTKDLDRQQQDWLDTGSLKPKQNMGDALSDAQTFGTLIQKYEETRPLPDIDPELADVDKIGLYIDVFFKGHTMKMLGIKNTFSNIYESVMKKFTVTKPEYIEDEDEDSELIFEKIFNSSSDV